MWWKFTLESRNGMFWARITCGRFFSLCYIDRLYIDYVRLPRSQLFLVKKHSLTWFFEIPNSFFFESQGDVVSVVVAKLSLFFVCFFRSLFWEIFQSDKLDLKPSTESWKLFMFMPLNPWTLQIRTFFLNIGVVQPAAKCGHSLKLTQHLKNDGWNNALLVSFWDSMFSGANCSFQGV